MRLVDNNDAVEILAEAFKQFPVFQHANRAEEMIMPIRFMVSDQQIAEVRVAQSSAIGVECLFEDLLAMCSEKKARPATEAITLTLVIERGDDGFSRSCRGDYEITPIPSRALGLKRLKNALLKCVWLDLEKDHRELGLSLLLRIGNCLPENFGAIGIKRNELAAVPVGFEFDAELFDNVRLILRCDFEVPLETLRHGSIRHIG